ncbi:Asp23/Gls24 family envelope stress response protein [Streptomyces sp. TRM70350]|uniref:Asp23/Gls24 family envelope stress response protein n=1 Tax=Streptomyces sp. TRM70350 TaxID=2856165 RepID=UPI001C45EB7E|nr:Asp23/Gls24 family envelope stress response protein [Streptomyces sp. TRM70350]MBV7695185.1 Asp23/Gls24 family envelope stress response protein [Streptomyces sp. TRM70350]
MTPVSSGADEPRATVAVTPAGERGQTSIADRVVAKIAAQAAREALGRLPQDAARPHATVVVRPQALGSDRPGGTPVDTARVRVHLELDYPSDIGSRCGQVRRHVVERVGALAGMEVPEVAVQVERLHLAATHPAQGRTR